MKKYLIIFILFFSVIFNNYTNEKIIQWINQYDNVLKRYVSRSVKKGIQLTVVDYKSLKNDQDFIHLNYKLVNLPSVENEKTELQIAFWINVYNYLTLVKAADNPDIKKAYFGV